ncbi:hypothetical protein [Psychroflexus tropicus]|uniref:hypothetical protein n=1 Tax=Psychroflexus tropicus TaxID=197345 RepID=UPI000372B60E|nr:hypothetical protein [Psychroflexus tropicus]
MKKIALLLVVVIAFLGCEGDRGPQGPPGGVERGIILETTGDFTAQNEYSFGYEFPNTVEVFESDVVQVFLLEEVIDDVSGPVDVWTPLDTSFFFDDGSQLVYNYNHTFFDVQFFLGGNVNFNTVSNDLLLGQTFRVAVIPADFAEKNPNLNSMEAIMQALPNAEIIKLK